MGNTDMMRILASLDEALNVFRLYEGQLEVVEIRARSMLSVVRKELAEHHARQTSPFGRESLRTGQV